MANTIDSNLGKIGGTSTVVPRPVENRRQGPQGKESNPAKVEAYLRRQLQGKNEKYNSPKNFSSARKRSRKR